ncbi:FAD-binding protein [Segetibacter sp. 3557_3]|uniref:NAD(P)/FAD-dependent oxidoreductase n=1 Tax=Segetibacter sp. 3557_3 TaxID=2547429 RepID=UPI001058A8A2|nr:FAD-dependent oxidoreductase [Segetibacter sp. 3557_3]TDH23083.1 FAD-binding protein [Segetibacter sp. 3557_3]
MNSSKIYDIAIIGGGLAGLALAIQGGKAGYKVALFEKEEYPYHKVCGEYISLESRSFIESLGVDLQGFGIPLIDTLQASDIDGKIAEFPLHQGGFGISRYVLDNYLFDIAKESADVFTKCKVSSAEYKSGQFTILSTAGHIVAKVVTGCYGKKSNLDVKFRRPFILQKPSSLNNYIGVKYHIRYPQPKNLISLHNFKNGYCGISNIEDDKCCLCYLTTAENLRSAGSNIKVMEQEVLAKNPQLDRIFSTAEFLYKEPLTISGVSFSSKSLVEDHILMVGDAAGMITPLCGNGMSMAMHSSKIAFGLIQDFLEDKISRHALELSYSKRWKQEFGSRLRTGRWVQQLFGGNFTTKVFLRSMNAVPSIAKIIIGLTHGKPF